jgi:nitrite reductase/ring-hydroxylating ferredoxin subunit
MWIEVADEADVPPGEAIVVSGVEPVAVFNVDGQLHALADTCSHARASLAEGFVEDGAVECPRHSARFSLTTGEALCKPATQPVAVYPVAVVGGKIRIEVAP